MAVPERNPPGDGAADEQDESGPLRASAAEYRYGQRARDGDLARVLQVDQPALLLCGDVPAARSAGRIGQRHMPGDTFSRSSAAERQISRLGEEQRTVGLWQV